MGRHHSLSILTLGCGLDFMDNGPHLWYKRKVRQWLISPFSQKERETSDFQSAVSYPVYFSEQPASLGTRFVSTVGSHTALICPWVDTCLGNSLGVNYTRAWLKWIFLLNCYKHVVTWSRNTQGNLGPDPQVGTLWEKCNDTMEAAMWQGPKQKAELTLKSSRGGWETLQGSGPLAKPKLRQTEKRNNICVGKQFNNSGWISCVVLKTSSITRKVLYHVSCIPGYAKPLHRIQSTPIKDFSL